MGMRQAQIISVVIIAAFTALIVYRRKKNKDKAGDDTEQMGSEHNE